MRDRFDEATPAFGGAGGTVGAGGGVCTTLSSLAVVAPGAGPPGGVAARAGSADVVACASRIIGELSWPPSQSFASGNPIAASTTITAAAPAIVRAGLVRCAGGTAAAATGATGLGPFACGTGSTEATGATSGGGGGVFTRMADLTGAGAISAAATCGGAGAALTWATGLTGVAAVETAGDAPGADSAWTAIAALTAAGTSDATGTTGVTATSRAGATVSTAPAGGAELGLSRTA